MDGTLALWFEGSAAPTAGEPADVPVGPVPTLVRPKVGLHVNLWRDLDRSVNFLDVGFLLTDVASLGRLYLYLPAPVAPSAILDLSDVLKDADTLNAVFNEVASVVREDDDHFVVDRGSGRSRVIHSATPGRDVTAHRINVPGRGQGTIMVLNSALCRRIRETIGDAEHYIRLRILLKGQARNLFTTEEASQGVGLSLMQDVSETTEFRLNERRSYPPAILQRALDGRVDLQSVHYFLIRSKAHQLASQHTTFRKVRNLETGIWDGYLAVGRVARRLPLRSRPDKGMVIYQWREMSGSDGKPLGDFIAYASFRTVQPKIFAYVIAVLAIGVVGSAVLNVGLATLRHLWTGLGHAAPGDGWLNLVAIVLGLIVISLLPRAHDLIWRRDR